jgi:hypothetical protein
MLQQELLQVYTDRLSQEHSLLIVRYAVYTVMHVLIVFQFGFYY